MCLTVNLRALSAFDSAALLRTPIFFWCPNIWNSIQFRDVLDLPEKHGGTRSSRPSHNSIAETRVDISRLTDCVDTEWIINWWNVQLWFFVGTKRQELCGESQTQEGPLAKLNLQATLRLSTQTKHSWLNMQSLGRIRHESQKVEGSLTCLLGTTPNISLIQSNTRQQNRLSGPICTAW